MKAIPAKAAKQIFLAQAALEACLRVPVENPLRDIQAALKAVTEANQWIVARALIENYRAQQKGAKR